MPPISRPISTGGLADVEELEVALLPASAWSSCLNAVNSTSAASTAEPIA